MDSKTLTPGTWHTVYGPGTRQRHYLVLAYIGPCGSYHLWHVREEGLFGEELNLLLPVGPAA